MISGKRRIGRTDFHIPANSGIGGFYPKEKTYMAGSRKWNYPGYSQENKLNFLRNNLMKIAFSAG